MACTYCGAPPYTRGLDGKTEYCREHYETHGVAERQAFLSQQTIDFLVDVQEMYAAGKTVEEIQDRYPAAPAWKIRSALGLADPTGIP